MKLRVLALAPESWKRLLDQLQAFWALEKVFRSYSFWQLARTPGLRIANG